ncbi:MAG: hypothetical protein HY686_05890 [Chloroflexi bacterium]|nr:hypothetical protein [Chloroflexota bacterium]
MRMKPPLAALRENLFLRTVLIVGVGVGLVGVGMLLWLRWRVEGAVREEAMEQALTVAQSRILKVLRPEDLRQPLAGGRLEEIDRFVKESILDPRLQRLKVWNARGTVVYSNIPTQIGETLPEHKEFLEALAGGWTWEVTEQPESPWERGLGTLLEVYAPLTLESESVPAGVLEVALPYSYYTRYLTPIRRAILLVMGISFLTLPVALYALHRTGWNVVRRQRDLALQRQREVEGLNRLLQADIHLNAHLWDELLRLRDELANMPASPADPMTLAARYAGLGARLGELATEAERLQHSPSPATRGET